MHKILLFSLCFFCYQLANGQIAEFGLSETEGCVPLTLKIADKSKGEITKWQWDFGNGNQSSLKNPGVIYTKPGNYTLQLKVWNAEGYWDTAVQIIKVFKKPTVNFLAKDSFICTNQLAELSPKIILGDAGIAEHFWDFGDGSISLIKQPNHIYKSPGLFNISLQAIDSNGCSHASQKFKYITVVSAPKVKFVSSNYGNCIAPHDVNFNSVVTGGKAPYTYVWDFGNGNQSLAENPKHTFNNKGDFDITLKVTDDNNCTQLVSKDQLIHIADLKGDIKLLTDSIQCGLNNNFRLEATSNFSPSSVIYKWKLSDGTQLSGKNIMHNFKRVGEYNVILEISNKDCHYKTEKKSWLKVIELPTTNINVKDTIMCKPGTVRLTAYNSKLKTYAWRAGEWLGASGANTAIGISKEGTYPVTLFIENFEGCSNLIKGPNIHFEIPNIRLVHNFDNDFCIPANKSFKDQSFGKYPITEFKWEWNYGPKGESATSPNFDSTKIIINDTGIFNLTYQITNSLGCKKDTVVPTMVGMKVQPINFSVNPKLICPAEDAFITDSTPPTGITPLHKTWKIADNLKENETDEASSTSVPGWHPVTLIYNHYGCKKDTTLDNMIEVKRFGGSILLNGNNCNDTSPLKPIVELTNVKKYTIIYPDGSNTINSVKTFSPLQGVNWVKMIIENDSLGCILDLKDSAWVPYILETQNRYDIIGNCTPVSVKAIGNVKDLKKLYQSKLFINNKLVETHTKPLYSFCNTNHNYTITESGSYHIKQVFYNFKGCAYWHKDTNIVIKGAKLKPSIQQNTFCSPIELILKDSQFVPNQNIKRYWITGSDTIWQKSNSVSVQLSSPLLINSKPHIIYVVDDGSTCVHRIPFEIKMEGGPPLLKTRTIADCHYPFYVAELLSSAKQSSIYWDFDGKLISGNTTKGIGKFRSPGEHKIRVRYRNLFDCAFDITKTVWVDTPKTINQFTVDKTSGNCPPVTINFTNTSKMIPGNKSFLWDFGDGSTSTLQHPKKTYFTPGNYSVRLIINNSNGCTDTLIKPQLINIKGPLGKFKFPETKECSPAQVNFELFETNADSFIWDMGDGTILKDIRNPMHNYSYPGKFIPVVILKDKSGCQYTMQPIDTIFTFDQPKVYNQNLIACYADSLILLPKTDLKPAEIKSVQWASGSDVISKEDSFSFKATQKGLKLFNCIIENQGSCNDTSLISIFTPQVKASFSTTKPKYCMNDSIHIKASTITDFPVSSYQWDIGGEKFMSKDVSLIATSIGTIPLELVIEDNKGCKDSLLNLKPWLIGDSNAPSIVPALYTSVVNDHEVELKYRKAENVDFWKYIILNPKNQNTWGEIENIEDTFISKTGLNTLKNSYCFKIDNINACLKESDSTKLKTHCTVDIEGKNNINHSFIYWTRYEGWDVNYYDIYRTTKSQPNQFTYLTQVSGNIHSYRDSNILCKTEYYYKVLAHEKEGNLQQSWSDTCHVQPIWKRNVPPPKNWRVTVEENEHILLEWQQPKNTPAPITWYNLQKVEGSKNAINIEEHKGLALIDKNTDVNAFSYSYWVQTQDSCGSVSDWSKVSKSILLQASLVKNKPLLTWNSYQHWEEGVDYYKLEYKNSNGQFELVTRITDTSFHHTNLKLNCIPAYEYRVTAYRNQMPDTNAVVYSRSNYVRVIPESKLFVPNAFTPNNNNLNEYFGPVGSYIIDYKMEIFNRWGEKLYETQNCMQGWNGKYMEAICQEGVYLYLIYARGIDGKVYNLKGNFTLLK